MQISRYAADHRVAFPDLLNIEADEGQLQYAKLCLLSSKTNRTVLKWFEAHVQRYTVGRINFEDKKFRGFRGYLLNLKIKYPRKFPA